jgi:hypothetical protein
MFTVLRVEGVALSVPIAATSALPAPLTFAPNAVCNALVTVA